MFSSLYDPNPNFLRQSWFFLSHFPPLPPTQNFSFCLPVVCIPHVCGQCDESGREGRMGLPESALIPFGNDTCFSRMFSAVLCRSACLLKHLARIPARVHNPRAPEPAQIQARSHQRDDDWRPPPLETCGTFFAQRSTSQWHRHPNHSG